RYISSFDYNRIRVKNEDDGTKWAVDESGSIRFFEIRNFKKQESMEIRLDGQSEWTLLSCFSGNPRIFFIENDSSYEMLEVTYNYVTGGIAETIYPDSYYVAMKGYHYQGMLGINGWIFPEAYTVNATVKAYRSSSSTSPDAEFEYTAEAIAGATFTRATITDDDIPYKPNSNDVARRESLLWQGDKAVAWRIPIKNSYGWLITESIGLRQGLHIGGDISGGSISSNYYLKIENDRLYLAPYESYWKNIEILTPVSQIIEKGYMDIRIESKNDVFRCFYCNKPLILYAERKSYDTEYNYSVIDYAIIGKDAYGNTLPERICHNFNSNVTVEYPISAWCLAADEIISPDNDSFTVKMEFKKYDKLGNGPVLINEYTNLRLGQIYSLNL
ncbi:MAG: hypothetical protein K2L75_05100, partial [Muribaculaceae bacterium]|nr:hypothetical protein [Muribaculaceae bacterium]